MRILVSDILKKIPDLPANVFDLVTLDEKGLAYVKSKTNPEDVYTTHLEPHKDDPGDKSILNGTCMCPASKLCWHMTAQYAIAKGFVTKDKPPVPREKPKDKTSPDPPPKDLNEDSSIAALKLIAEGQQKINAGMQMLVDGAVMLARKAAQDEMRGAA